MITPVQAHTLLGVCVEAYERDPSPKNKLRLATAAAFFAQIAEHVEKQRPLTSQVIARCQEAISVIHADHKSN